MIAKKNIRTARLPFFMETPYIGLAAILLLFQLGCTNNENSAPRNEVALFPYTISIDCPPYHYTQTTGNEMVTYYNGADSSRGLNLLDTLGNTPEFRWEKTDAQFITMVIATDSLQVVNNSIKNAANIKWQWHNGMTSGSDGSVKFSDLKPVISEKIQYEMQPDTLKSGLYYYAIWTWRQNGKDLFMSSQQQKFYVK